jgi:hypothetical protein
VVPYIYHGYPKVARNVCEMDKSRGFAVSQANPVAERVLRPRYLCFLREAGQPAMVLEVEEWCVSVLRNVRNRTDSVGQDHTVPERT